MAGTWLEQDGECIDPKWLLRQTGSWSEQDRRPGGVYYPDVGLYSCICHSWLTLTCRRAATTDTTNIKTPSMEGGRRHHLIP
jgi:hypothetical protein